MINKIYDMEIQLIINAHEIKKVYFKKFWLKPMNS